ncbi:PREDICTED: uncharacterized protein LOC104803086, partial [Tarenaya hassleriana]|uniref:uncharacterized protein LOC104803086 n=1 Tax=Tarenaya hassleriana TaxID=28532 RepID=UPI00053C8DDD
MSGFDGETFTKSTSVKYDIINYSCRDNHTGDDNIDQRKHSQSWSTWEELLLACAVKRHGFHDWDSVAMEVQSRSSLPRFLTTAQNCKHKYRDLKRRFEDDGVGDNETEDGDDKADNIPWLNQLRGLRVAELRRDLQRYDVSILSLESKVKKLEEERDRSVGCQKPDLDDDSKGERSENDVTEPARPNTVMAEEKESDRENGSINESNSTASGGKLAGDGDETSRAREDSGNPD